MVSKRTKWMSGLVAVVMLISMLTAFVLPVSADPTTGGIVEGNGLYDATKLPNIKDGIQADKFAYQVNDYDGMLKMSDLVNTGKNKFGGITVYQTADIDMGWQMFPGIGYGENYTKPFKGTFDGNGFTIDNLYVTRTGEADATWYKGYGLFGTAEGATLKNIGISGGLIVGADWVGSIVGRGVDNEIYNCWNAATVIGNTTEGTGGIAGNSVNGSTIVNCYNVGAVINRTYKSCGLVGWANNADDYIANSYNAGQLVSGTPGGGAQMQKYAEILICEFNKGYSAKSENNYYVKGRSAMISSVAEYLEKNGGQGVAVAPGTTTVLNGTDGAHGVDVAGLTDGTLANGLNSNPIVEKAIVGDYTVTYENVDGVGYPVLTYKDAEGNIVAQRYAKDNTNVNGDKTLENASPLFAQMVASNGTNFKVSGAITINTSDDLFFVSNLLYANLPTIIATENKITLAADVDMDARATFPGIKHFIPFGLHKASFTGTFDGASHTIANWGFVATTYWEKKSTDGGLISTATGSAYVVKDLGLINAYGRFENAAYDGKGGTAYPGLLICKNTGTAGKGAIVTNCFVTGTMEMASIENYNNDGAIFGTPFGAFPVISNCWADVKITGKSAKNTTARVIGNLVGNQSWSNIVLENMSTNIINSSSEASKVVSTSSNAALQAEQRIGKAAGTKEHAWYLNNLSGWDQIFTVKNGTTTFGDTTNRTGKIVITGGAKPQEFYANAGEKVTLNYIEGADCSYDITTANTTASVDGSTLTMGSEDIEITATLKVVDKNTLQEYYDEYSDKNSEYFKTSEGKDMDTLLEETAVILGDDSITQSIVNDKVAEFKTVVYVGYPNVPLASEFSSYPDAPAYRIVTPADMEALSQYDGDFAAGTTMYLMNNLDMTGSSFAGTYQFKGNFDGNGKTISNMDFNGTGMFSYYAGSFIKNLTIAESTVTVTGNTDWGQANFRTGLFIGNYTGTKLDIDNVHIVDCVYDNSTTGSNSGGAIFLARTNTNATINITNSGLDNCIYNQNNVGGNLGLFLGQMTSGAAITLRNIYVTNNHIQNAGNNSLFAGCVEGGADLYATNVLIANNKISDDKVELNNCNRFAGNIKESGTNVELTRVVITGTVLDMEPVSGVASDMMVNNIGVKPDSLKYTDCYVESSKWVQNPIDTLQTTGGQLKITAGDLPAIAYLLNNKSEETDYKWEIAEGKIVRDTNGAGLPLAIEIQLADAETLEIGAGDTLYTDVNGLVSGGSDMFESAVWPYDVATKVFTEETTVTGYTVPEHECEWEYTQGEGVHSAVCTKSWNPVEGVVVKCDNVLTDVACTFTNYSTVDANAVPNEAAHKGTCVCGNTHTVLCSEGGESWLVESEDATCDTPSSVVYNCTVCDYSHEATGVVRDHDFSGEWTYDAENHKHNKECAYDDCAITQTGDCTYGAWNVVTEPTAETTGLKERTCSVCGGVDSEVIPALPSLALDNSKDAIKGADVVVNVNINNVAAFATGTFNVTYDADGLNLTGATADGAEVVVGTPSEPDADGMVTVAVAYNATADITEDGTVLALTFHVKDTAENGEYSIAVAAADVKNIAGDEVAIQGGSSTVNVTAVKGDINGDNKTSVADAVLLLRYVVGDTDLNTDNLNLDAADVTGDGEVLADDIVKILQFLVGRVIL